MIHAHWRDGGLNIPQLSKRLELLQIRSFIGLLSSDDSRVSQLFKISMIDEAKSRHFNTDDTDSFFGFKSPTIYHNNSLKTNNAFIRAFKAAKKLGVSITEDQDNNSSLESHVSSHPTSFSLKFIGNANDNDSNDCIS